MLQFLREHPHAPIFRSQSGHRLFAEDLERVCLFEKEVQEAHVGWKPGEAPAWLGEFIAQCVEEVPAYRRYGSPTADLFALPTVSRADLSRDIAQFVPDSAPVERLINFRTSGTTGHPLLLASHPIVAASYLAFHKRALRRFGITLRHGRGQVGVMLIGWQRKCFTYVSVTPSMDESGVVKINLHPGDWCDPDDRAAYVDAMAPEVIAGDPISFAELAQLPVQHRPRALLCTSMALLPGLRAHLEERFGCAVLDLYSMNEAGPIAVADPVAGGHVLLQHRMCVEILNEAGKPLPLGECGEVTLTGGFNFCLPLLRYRTGDFAALHLNGPEPVLIDLEGRPPVRYRTTTGGWVNNIEITHALRAFAISQYTLHQSADGRLELKVCGPLPDARGVRTALLELFGSTQLLDFQHVCHFEGKVIQYTSEFRGVAPQ